MIATKGSLLILPAARDPLGFYCHTLIISRIYEQIVKAKDVNDTYTKSLSQSGRASVKCVLIIRLSAASGSALLTIVTFNKITSSTTSSDSA
jgi:hypothetical protein